MRFVPYFTLAWLIGLGSASLSVGADPGPEPQRVFTASGPANPSQHCVPAQITLLPPPLQKTATWTTTSETSEETCNGITSVQNTAPDIQQHCDAWAMGSATTTPGGCASPGSACIPGSTSYSVLKYPLDTAATQGDPPAFHPASGSWAGGTCTVTHMLTCRYNSAGAVWTAGGSVVDCR